MRFDVELNSENNAARIFPEGSVCTNYGAAGVGEGSRPLPKTATARTGKGSGRGFFLLILSVA